MSKTPPPPERPQICLITPPDVAAEGVAQRIAALLDAVDVACLRYAPASADPDAVARGADLMREIAHARDVPVVIERHILLVPRHGLDGVHLTDGARSLRAARRDLGADAIVGAFCGTTRHEGISAAEAGADYVAFGPCGESALGDGRQVADDLFGWWSEMIEVPVIAEGALDPARVGALAPFTDFFAFGPEVWAAPDPLAALRALAAAIERV